MPNSKPRILYISSANPLKGPGTIGMTHYRQLKSAGFEVDMLTFYKVEGHPDILYVYSKKRKPTLLQRIRGRYRRITNTTLPGQPYFFFYKKEKYPPVPIADVLKVITKDYDMLVVYFIQGMLSFATIDAIYEKLRHPVTFFIAPDFSYMTGGCHFPGDCHNYQTGCGCCPAINSHKENDFTHWNAAYRKKVYEKIKPIVFGNSYMQSFYRQSYLLKDGRTVRGKVVANTELYRPLNKSELRQKYHIDEDVKFIIAFGCQQFYDERKGMKYLIEALCQWCQTLTEHERNQILLLAAGSSFDEIQSELPFPSIGLGMIPIEQLPEFYSIADVFVCPSVNDPGPSMVLQSICCGTPVVGFEMGAMLDFVKDKGTGYCAKLKNSKDLMKGIDKYYRMSIEERITISSYCRDQVLSQYTSDEKLNQWMELYNKYK